VPRAASVHLEAAELQQPDPLGANPAQHLRAFALQSNMDAALGLRRGAGWEFSVIFFKWLAA